MSDETTLLPCPFCGGNAKLTTWTPTAASISCIMCGAHFNTYTKAEAIAAWNTRAERGTLTAEQVREAVEASTWAETSTIRNFNDSSWQAIADELNATIDGDECEWALREKWPNRTGDDHVYGYETGCGARHTWWPDSLPKFCPTCGGKVKAVK